MSKTFWLLSAGFAAIATPAYAQDVTTPEEAPTSASGTEDGALDQGNSQDIVITAQGRRQILQDVPLAVSAVSAAQLQNSGANDIRQLNQLAPSLLVSSTGSEANGSPVSRYGRSRQSGLKLGRRSSMSISRAAARLTSLRIGGSTCSWPAGTGLPHLRRHDPNHLAPRIESGAWPR